MKLYEKFYNDGDINKILDATNEIHKDVLLACHGRYHALQVVETTEYILQSLGFDPKTIELGKIAALLHDIGCIAGRWKHAQKSAALAGVFLSGIEESELTQNDKEIIIQAIADHSSGKNITSAVGAAVLIGDKTDFSKKRIFPLENIDEVHKNLQEVEKIDIKISNKLMTINYITTENFSHDIFTEDILTYQKPVALPKKAAKFLGIGCHYQINGIDKNF